MRIHLLVALGLAPAFVQSVALADFTGRVVNVNEGDALTVVVIDKEIRVRLESIDAPEAKQAFGMRSQQSLAKLCADKTALVSETGRDRYGRTLGWVRCDGVDANLEQVRRGMAWVYRRYAGQGSSLYKAEALARARQLGLWSEPRPMPPWDWREARKDTQRK